MPKTYYIFSVIIFLIAFFLGGFLTKTFYCKCSQDNSLFLKEVNTDSKDTTKTDTEVCDFFVDVSGAVMNPGVFCVQQGAIINDAIVKAGGFNPSAYAFKYVAQKINLARILEKEEKIYIPFRDDVVCRFVEDEQVIYIGSVVKAIEEGASNDTTNFSEKTEEGTEENSVESCININTASKEKIMELKGIGEAKANDIIVGRPYSKIEDLKEVKGIGEKTFEDLKDFICI